MSLFRNFNVCLFVSKYGPSGAVLVKHNLLNKFWYPVGQSKTELLEEFNGLFKETNTLLQYINEVLMDINFHALKEANHCYMK